MSRKLKNRELRRVELHNPGVQDPEVHSDVQNPEVPAAEAQRAEVQHPEVQHAEVQVSEVQTNDLKLLIEWSSPWREFLTALGPALRKSPKRLAGEARTNSFPYKGMFLSWLVEAVVVLALIILPARLASLRPYQAPTIPKYDVIFFSGDNCPRPKTAEEHAPAAPGTQADTKPTTAPRSSAWPAAICCAKR